LEKTAETVQTIGKIPRAAKPFSRIWRADSSLFFLTALKA
jgi:hypothetical protein